MGATLSAEASGVLRPTIRILLTLAVFGTAGLSLQAWIAAPHVWQPAGLAAAGLIAPLSLALAILGIPAGIRLLSTPKRALRDALLVLAAAGIILAIAAGSADLTMLTSITLIALVFARRLWPQVGDRQATATGFGLLLGAGTAVLALFLLDRPSGMALAIFGLVLAAAITGAAWGLVLLMRNAPLPIESDHGPVHAVYNAYAAAGVSPFALMKDKRWFWSRDRKAFLAYGARAGVAVVLGPGIGPRESVQSLYREFRQACHERGWKLGFYQVPANLTDELGWGTRYLVGSEAVVDLTRLTLEGPVMAKLRHEVSRGKRNGVTVRIQAKADLTPQARQAMASLAASWGSRHALGEMSFSVSHRSDSPAAPAIFGLAYDKANRLVAYCSWLALPGSGGMVLDEIRRVPETPAGAMDLLLYACMEQLKQQATWASLGLAPVASAPANRLAQIADQALHRLGLASVSASLFSFKGKFQPRWEPRYMVAERLADWPALGVAAFLVHYPDVEQRLHRVLPRFNARRQTRIAAGLAGALIAAGTSGILAAAAQSREGHPLYTARLAATTVTAVVLPLTGTEKKATPRRLATGYAVHKHRSRPAGTTSLGSRQKEAADPEQRRSVKTQHPHKLTVGTRAKISVFEREREQPKPKPAKRPGNRQ